MQVVSIQIKKVKEFEENIFVCGDEWLFKIVVIYGVNVLGKSSFIKVICVCVGMIFLFYNYNENMIFVFILFKFGGIGKLSIFFICFFFEGIEYEYFFEFNKVEILKEVFYYYLNGCCLLVFFCDEIKGFDKKNIYEFCLVICCFMDVVVNIFKKMFFVLCVSQMD